ncbi:MAG TPA: hypothetical protein VF712_10085 [Thermoleophilaceae bacterium]|jgi:hypothetical protein
MEEFDQASEPDPNAEPQPDPEPEPEQPQEEAPPAFPAGEVSLPDGSPIPSSGEVTLSTEPGIQKVGPFWFCYLWNGTAWGQLAFWAPGPNEAALSAQQIVPLLQAWVDRAGYKGVTVGVRPGRCG